MDKPFATPLLKTIPHVGFVLVSREAQDTDKSLTDRL